MRDLPISPTLCKRRGGELGGFKYDHADTDVTYTGVDANVFTCNRDGSVNKVEYEGANYQDALNYCGQQVTNFHGDSVQVVEYFVPKDAIPWGFSEYATKNGFKNKFYMTLHQAEQEYAPACSEVFNSKKCGLLGENYIHQPETWEQVGMDPSGYENGNYIQSWVTANGATTNAEIAGGGGTVDQDSVFRGGFAGKCGGGQKWQYVTDDNQWACTGSVPGLDLTVYIPNVQNYEDEKKTNVGVFFHPATFTETKSTTLERSIPSQALKSKDVMYSVEQVKVACAAGDSPPTDSTPNAQKFTKTLDIATDPSYDNFVPVVGTIDISSHTQYTCEWSFKLRNTNTGNTLWADAENDILEGSNSVLWTNNVEAMRGEGDAYGKSFLPATFGGTTVDMKRGCNLGSGKVPCMSSKEVGILAENWP